MIIDFVGSIDGEEFEGGKAEDFALELGKGRMIPGFEKPPVGAKAGDVDRRADAVGQRRHRREVDQRDGVHHLFVGGLSLAAGIQI